MGSGSNTTDTTGYAILIFSIAVITTLIITILLYYRFYEYFIPWNEVYSDVPTPIPVDEPIYVKEGILVKIISIESLPIYLTEGWKQLSIDNETILVYKYIWREVVENPSRYMYVGELIYAEDGESVPMYRVIYTALIGGGTFVAIIIGGEVISSKIEEEDQTSS